MPKSKQPKQAQNEPPEDPPSINAVDGGGFTSYLEDTEGQDNVEVVRAHGETKNNGGNTEANNDLVNIKLSTGRIVLLSAALLFLVFAVGFCGGLAGSAVMINRDEQGGIVNESAAPPSADSGDSESSGDTAPITQPSTQPTVAKTNPPVLPPTNPPVEPMTRQEIQSFLEQIVPDQGATFSDATSPQSRALEWLHLDMLNPARRYPESQMIQRYVLAVLFLSTTGEGWDNTLNFLSRAPECEWGVSDGYIPTWYGYMEELMPACDDTADGSTLVALSIPGNDLFGTIPEELGLLTNLEFLTFRNNPLSGPIPTIIGQLTKLQILRIVDTQVTGQIPTEFGELRLLDYLDLAGNNLSGTIPTEFGRLTSLAGLWIHDNPRLGGTVPEELGLMRSAETIAISNTDLTGVVPSSVCNIREGRVSIGTVCDQSQLLCCCCTGCCSEFGCVGYGSGTICENQWYDTCGMCSLPTFEPSQEGTFEPSQEGDGTNDGTDVPEDPTVLSSQDYKTLNYRVVDAEYSKVLDRIIMVSSEPNKIHVYDPSAGKDDAVFSLSLSPSCVSVSPDGLTAAVGHDGWISYVDLTADSGNLQAVQTIAIATDVYDIVLAGNGFIYAFPRADQWVNIHSLEIATETETLHAGISIRETTRARLHPSGTKIYGANQGLSPSDFERYNIAAGAAEYAYDSPYHGDYPISGNLWFSEDGGRIFTRGRTVFRSSDNRDMDMIYAGSIGSDNNSGGFGATPIESLDHSAKVGIIALIPAEPWYGEIDENTSSDAEIEMYEESFLGHIYTLTLPQFFVPQTGPHAPHGKFLFFDSTGENFHVVAQADASANMLYDYATITVPTNITGETL